MTYVVKVVNTTGTVLATLANATVTEITWELNEPGSATISVPVGDPDALDIGDGLPNEVQVWRDGALVFWGVWLQSQYDETSQSEVWTCPGLLWYFTRRHFGPISVNYLANPNFATNLTGWSSVDVDSGTRSTAIRLRGAGTLRLVSTASGDRYAQHTFSVNTGAIGLVLFLAGWYWIDPTTTFTAPALEERGIYIDSPNCLPDSTPSWEPITMNAQVGVPQRVETELHLPAGLTGETVTVRLYSIHGAIHWGALSVTALESVSSDPGGTDATEMMRRVVDYAQNGTGKSDLDIATSTPAAGVTEILAYQFADLGGIFDALRTYPARGLADYAIVNTSATVRTFTTFAPTKGSLKSGSALSVPGADIVRMGYSRDGQQSGTKKIVRGTGDGPDRELGVATDTSLLGGLVLEDVEDAPPEMSVDALDSYAATGVARTRRVVTMPEAEVAAEGWIGTVDVGDTVPFTIDWGSIQDTSTRRVVRQTLNCVEDRVRVLVNAT